MLGPPNLLARRRHKISKAKRRNPNPNADEVGLPNLLSRGDDTRSFAFPAREGSSAIAGSPLRRRLLAGVADAYGVDVCCASRYLVDNACRTGRGSAWWFDVKRGVHRVVCSSMRWTECLIRVRGLCLGRRASQHRWRNERLICVRAIA